MFRALVFHKLPSKSGISLDMEFSYSLENIHDAARWLLDAAGDRKIITFHGDLGAGKTTLIAEICSLMNVVETVSSPTFSIINVYTAPEGEKIFHLDLYRLKSEREAIDAGVEDCLASESLCLVEWPERAPDFFTGEMHCYISIAGSSTRKLRIIV